MASPAKAQQTPKKLEETGEAETDTKSVEGSGNVGPSGEQIYEYYNKLNANIEYFNDFVNSQITSHEQDFMSAFKVHMNNVYKQLDFLKKKTDDHEMNLRKDEKFQKMQTTADWFRQEALSLRNLNVSLKADLDKWKAKAQTYEVDRQHFEGQMRVLKKENTMLKVEIQKLESETAARTPQIASPAANQPDLTLSATFDEFVSQVIEKYSIVRASDFIRDMIGFQRHVESKAQEAIRVYQNMAEIERKRSRTASAQRFANYPDTRRGELETLFAQCVEEIKKDVQRRNLLSYTGQQWNKRRPTPTKRPAKQLIAPDKKRLLEAFVCNEKVLGVIHDLTFPKPNRFLPQPPATASPSKSVELDEQVPTELFEHPARSVTPSIMRPNRILE